MGDKSNSKIRLYVTAGLGEGAVISLDPGQAHYLLNVMRCRPGDTIRLFNGRDGEWRAEIIDLKRKSGTARCMAQLRPQPAEPDVWLLFAPVKKARIDFIAEKATELGAARLLPVVTERTAVSRVNTDRLAANVREAAEQCERLSVPDVAEPAPLAKVLTAWPAERSLVFADTENGTPALAAFSDGQARPPAALLVGPEGGFSPEEHRLLSNSAAAVAVNLGPRILRAETAVAALLTLWQAARGDWRSQTELGDDA